MPGDDSPSEKETTGGSPSEEGTTNGSSSQGVASEKLFEDWHSDVGIETEQKWADIVTMVDGKCDGYKLDEVLRGGFFKMKAPLFSEPYVLNLTKFIVLITVVVALVFIIGDMTNLLTIDSSLVAQSANIFAYFSGLAGFLFGFFIFNNLALFNHVKNICVGGFWSNYLDLMILTGVWFPGKDHKTKAFKESVVRWGMATFFVMCGAADPDRSEEDVVKQAVGRGLLTKEEGATLTHMGGHPEVPLLWVIDAFKPMLVSLPGAGVKAGTVNAKIMAMRKGASGALVAVSHAGLQPLPLVHLMALLVKLQLFLLAAKEGIFIADVVQGGSSGKIPQILFAVLMVVVTPIVLQGLLEFVIQIRNPFGSDWVDFPTTMFFSSMRDEMYAMVAIGEDMPSMPTNKAIKGVPARVF